jgi:hypothetical protein
LSLFAGNGTQGQAAYQRIPDHHPARLLLRLLRLRGAEPAAGKVVLMIRVADPYSFDTDPDPGPGVLMKKNLKNLQLKKIIKNLLSNYNFPIPWPP